MKTMREHAYGKQPHALTRFTTYSVEYLPTISRRDLASGATPEPISDASKSSGTVRAYSY